MYYSYYKRMFPERILVTIEEFNKQDGTVLFDFIDSNEYVLFTESIGAVSNLDKPTMVFLKNYNGRTIRENTIYSIELKTIQEWRAQLELNSDNIDSFLIGYNIDVLSTEQAIFMDSVSIDNVQGSLLLRYYMWGKGDDSKISFSQKGKISVTIRKVGQGNWNEINFDAIVKVVFDAGAPLHASKKDVVAIIGNRNILYPSSKPMLILSHWDKDHYHALIGMSNTELQNNFCAFVCRDRIPNLTSRTLFARISSAIGTANTYCIPANHRTTRGGPTLFSPFTSFKKQIVLFNSQYNSNRNISGLAVSVKTKVGSIILTGDAHYEQISRDILSTLNYTHKHNLVVPHHGGKAGTYKYSIPKLATVGQAIISVGKNGYGHPLTHYISALKASGFIVQLTQISINDIIITL